MHASILTIWPDYIRSIEPGSSESLVIAPQSSDAKIITADSTLPANIAAWSGEWLGWAGQGRLSDLRMTVESLQIDGATIIYATGSSEFGAQSQRLNAVFSSNELQATLASGVRIVFRMRTANVVEVVGNTHGKVQFGGVLSNLPLAQPYVYRAPTAFVESGNAVSLEVVIYKPLGDGPFPAVMFNHGSTGSGDDPALFTSTWTSLALAQFFTERGWLVAFPQRRGRGKSGGLYDEGFEPDRSGYSNRPQFSLPGVDRALQDIDVATDYLAGRQDVDANRMLLGGESRGGIASIAYAGCYPDRFMGVLNFVGGWVGEDSRYADTINGNIARRGASYPLPTLWLYGESDSFYKISHSKSNFDAFIQAGGKGEFKVLNAGVGQDGHGVISQPDLWRSAVDDYLKLLGLP